VVVAFTYLEARKVIILEIGQELERTKECNCATCHWDPNAKYITIIIKPM
jgi:hypothetical protein